MFISIITTTYISEYYFFNYLILCRETCRSFPHSLIITGFVTRLVGQEQPTLPEHLSSPPFCPFSFGHCVVSPSSIYEF